ncbi:hypothetical protein GJV03_08065 [Acinetobacter sp. RIT698]|jgi:hypothetical protein|uniref:hypothetical protein n=1 Tax=Acinetobacter TaxID=469 RepID=UPI000CFFB672|nr:MULTISPECIES: hypothetical protein [unclassified Acinetobacter]MRT37114.1 hypothetical protein [Acinetobacter sp. RIT698]QLD61419.1 hypothetical protein CQZ96_009120 [Acinetobacter sp. MYb10]
MSKVSIELSARARNTHSLVLQSLGSVVNATLGEEIGFDGPWVSKFKNDKKNNGLTDLETICVLLDKLGLKVIPGSYECYDRKFVEAIFFLARMQITNSGDINDYQFASIAPRLAEFGY